MKTVLFDVDTQLDFLFAAGALAVPGAAELAPALAKLTQFGALRHLPIVSTVDAHSQNDPEFQQWPPHCVLGSTGQQKASFTLFPQAAVLPNILRTGEQLRELSRVPQVIVQKQDIDAFTNVNLRLLLEMIAAERYFVYGVATEVCVAKALFGLLPFGKPVSLITDATRALTDDAYRDTISRFKTAGGQVTTVSEVIN